MRLQLLALALTAAALQPAAAGTSPVILNFENLPGDLVQLGTQQFLGDFSFVGDAYGVKTSLNGCGGSIPAFIRPNSCGALFLANQSASETAPSEFKLTLEGGFVDKVFFSSSLLGGAQLAIKFFDAAGGLVSSSARYGTVTGCGATGVLFCDWSDNEIQLEVGKIASSMVVSGINLRAVFDDFKFTAPASTGTPLPEPGGVALALGALGALAWTRKRTKR